MSRQLILDTNTLSLLKRGDVDLTKAKKADIEYYVPVTQELEFLEGVDGLSKDLREAIHQVLDELDVEEVELDSAPFGVGPFGRGPFGKVSENYQHIKSELDELSEHENNAWDALGAETAISRDMEFVTQDTNLQKVLDDFSQEHLLRYNKYKKMIEESSSHQQ